MGKGQPAKKTTTKPPDDVPNAGVRGQIISKLVQSGVKGTELAKIITAGKSRKVLWNDLKVYAKSLKKAGQ